METKLVYFNYHCRNIAFWVSLKAIPNITERMLTKQLRELKADGVVKRKAYRQVLPKVEYFS